MTMTQKILAKKAGLREVRDGEIVMAKANLILANDITAPVSIKELEKLPDAKLSARGKTVFVLDHFTPNKDIKSAENCRMIREFARIQGIKNVYDGAAAGVEHALLPEKGFIHPGDLIIGADSHTCTYGALNAFSTGMGSTDIAAAMVTGEAWFKVPGAINIRLSGKLRRHVSGKDVILHLIGLIGVDGALNKSLEFTGNIKALSADDRFTIANMCVEAGATNGIFAPDEITSKYVSSHSGKPGIPVYPDEGCYNKSIELELSKIPLTATCPHSPSNTKPVSELKKEKINIDQVVIGSCTNGRYSDLETAAEVLRDKKVRAGIRAIVIPATPEIYGKALKNGLLGAFSDSGFIISPPTCGPCLGGFMGILADGERAVSTTNRNFVGRMGHTGSEVYLVSPYIAAKSALKGYISD